jgi:hypothetical protein
MREIARGLQCWTWICWRFVHGDTKGVRDVHISPVTRQPDAGLARRVRGKFVRRS